MLAALSSGATVSAALPALYKNYCSKKRRTIFVRRVRFIFDLFFGFTFLRLERMEFNICSRVVHNDCLKRRYLIPCTKITRDNTVKNVSFHSSIRRESDMHQNVFPSG